MLACYGHMAIAFKARVMPEAEGCNAYQSAADVNTHSLIVHTLIHICTNQLLKRCTALRSGPKMLMRLTSLYLQTGMQSASPPYLAA